MKKGDVYRLIQAGAGGYGDSLDRDLDAIMNDVLEGKLTVPYVREEYGVVIDPDTLVLDARATDELRAKMRRERENGG